MTPDLDKNNTLLSQVLEVLSEEGFSGMAQVFSVLFNEAMKRERSEALKALPYERTEERQGYANGYKPKTIETRVGAVTVEIPQVRGMSFYPRSLERGCRSERALKLAVAEMYVQGVSTRKVKEITEQLCGLELTSMQVSRCAALLDQELDKFRNRSLGAFPYVLLDARYEKVRYEGQVIDVALLVAVGISLCGKRELLGLSVSLSEAEAHWRDFLQSLKERGLHGIDLLISDDHAGLKAARKAVFAGVPWQRCQFHFAQNAQAYVPKRHMRQEIADAVRDVFAAPTRQAALEEADRVAQQYRTSAAEFSAWLLENVEDCLQVYSVPKDFQVRLRTVNSMEVLNREIKRRTNVARIFPNTGSLLRLATAVLVEIHEGWIESKMPYLNMKKRSQQEPKTRNKQIYRKKVA
jgi:transposase-like protein